MPTKDEIELYHFWTGHEQPPIDMFLDKFEWKYPIRIRRNAMEWSVYSMVVKARLVRGDPPDIVVYDLGRRIFESAKEGELTDVSDVWKEENFSTVFPEWVKNACSANGGIYGVPVKCFTFVVWYLRDIFEKYRITPPKTWDEFLEVCGKFKKAGLSPMVASGWEVSLWFENILVRTVGPEFYNRLMRGEESWTDPKVLDAYETLLDLAKKYFQPYPFSYSFRESWISLNNREAGMQLQGDWVNGMWRRGYNYQPGRDFNYFPVPPISKKVGQVMITGGNAWMVPARARHRKNTMTFLRYAGSHEGQSILAREGAGLVGRKDVGIENYDPVSKKLLKDLKGCPTVLQMDALLPSQVASVEKLQQMQLILNPRAGRKEVKRIAFEIEEAARKFRGGGKA